MFVRFPTLEDATYSCPCQKHGSQCCHASETWRDTKKINIFERKVQRRILSSVYNNEKEKWGILTNEEIYSMFKNPLHRDNKVK
jgi:hypothetical protein